MRAKLLSPDLPAANTTILLTDETCDIVTLMKKVLVRTMSDGATFEVWGLGLGFRDHDEATRLEWDDKLDSTASGNSVIAAAAAASTVLAISSMAC